ncbi:LOW QUALITY PROTEIN: hypothetical protein HID58_060143 [Brassica napus]|uniref:Uncharacterized protein n=1 Tax=Brassica napus TaxID=3708 RepID=A0ABQ7ZVH8_BRANA|nr:LOW QUALITY PROTEIN: hypothetical protein HID58_060143 [Brassica napus]
MFMPLLEEPSPIASNSDPFYPKRNLGFWAQCVLRQLSDSVGAFDVINPFGSFDLRRLGPAVGRGGSLSELYISAKRILLRARDGIERLERFESAALMDSSDLTSSVKRDITEVQSLCASMDGYGAQSPCEKAEYLNKSLEKYTWRNQRKMTEARERESRFVKQRSGEGAHILQIFDDEAQAMNSKAQRDC